MMTKKEYQSIVNNKVAIRIEYKTPYSTGTIEIDRSVYLKKIKKFQRLFADCSIIKFEEVNKPDDRYCKKGGK